MISRNGFFYGVGFALVNAAEAAVILATLGVFSPKWVMAYASWHMRRSFRRQK